MPEYIVKTICDRNLVIEADYYLYNATEESYEFFAKDEKADVSKVASVLRSPEILAIVKDEAEQADFYWNQEDDEDDPEEDNYDETCLDCRLDEFTESPAFFDAVWSILDFYLSPANQEDDLAEQTPLPVPQTPTAIPGQVNEKYPIEHWREAIGREWWGFNTPNGFIHFSDKGYAEDSRKSVEKDSRGWGYLNLTGATRLED